MDHRRAEELFSDHFEGTLHAVLRAELERHLAAEEQLVVPTVARLPADEQRAILDEMRARRRKA